MGFMDSDPSIYQTMQIGQGSYLDKTKKNDYVGFCAPVAAMGYVFDPKDGRWRNPHPGNAHTPTPWCHHKGTPYKHCNLDHTIIFNQYRIIPPRCLNCWKVTVTPRTFKELLGLEQMQRQLDLPSKCGIEARDYVPKHYGGYFYNNSLEEGKWCYETVRKAVDEHLGKDVAVILKRGCTEFEMIKGPSPFWHITAEEQDAVDIIEAYVDTDRGNNVQSNVTKHSVRVRWFVWAHMIGDMTYKEFNNGEALFPDYVTYHEGDIEEMNRDLALAAGRMAGIETQDAIDWLGVTDSFSTETGIPITALKKTLNAADLQRVNILDLPMETKGEEDQLSG